MRPSHVCEALHYLVRIRQPVFLWGPPGVGKSRLVADVARRQGRKLYDLRAVLLDPVDLRGLPRISDEGITSWCVPEFLPHPQDTEEGILFLDELNAAPPLVQAACYQLILDRRVGQYRLPDGWAVVAAGNRESDRAVTYRMPSALANRMVHLDVECHIDDWLDWARDNGIREEIQAFLRFRPRLLHDFDPRSSDRAFASPRSWEFASRILDAAPDGPLEEELLAGTIGQAAAVELSGFLREWRHLPSVESVLSDPEEAPVPADPASLYALCEALALRTEGYEAQSVAAFDRALADWTNEAAFHAREERIRRLLCSYEEDGPEAEFVLGTLAAAMGACSARHYGGYCTQITPAYADAAAYTRSEDVFGDSYVVYEASASYTIRYQMPDESRLTVGERDRILTRYRDAVQAFLDGKTEDELSKEEAMTRALKRELKRLDQSLSTQWMALEGTRLNDYFAYGPEGGETP